MPSIDVTPIIISLVGAVAGVIVWGAKLERDVRHQDKRLTELCDHFDARHDELKESMKDTRSDVAEIRRLVYDLHHQQRGRRTGD